MQHPLYVQSTNSYVGHLRIQFVYDHDTSLIQRAKMGLFDGRFKAAFNLISFCETLLNSSQQSKLYFKIQEHPGE